jgi:putative transcriptional regulator
VNQHVTLQAHSPAIDQLLAEFSNGSLPRPLHVLMDAHLELSVTNRDFVSALEDSCALRMQSVTAKPLRNRDDRLQQIFDEPEAVAVKPIMGDILPSALAAYIGKPLDQIVWKNKLFGIKEAKIETVDGVEASLLWVKAGRRMPSHTHDGSEATLVLSGAFSDGSGRYKRGDIAVADSDVDHHPIIDADSDCICFVVTDAPLRLTGPIGRIFSQLFGR